ncbi:unnamed protein product, partial [Iphiclides podalirius]
MGHCHDPSRTNLAHSSNSLLGANDSPPPKATSAERSPSSVHISGPGLDARGATPLAASRALSHNTQTPPAHGRLARYAHHYVAAVRSWCASSVVRERRARRDTARPTM